MAGQEEAHGAHAELAAAIPEMKSDSNAEWLTDSGASRHMTNDKTSFANYRPVANEYITVANNNKVRVHGIRDTTTQSNGRKDSPPHRRVNY